MWEQGALLRPYFSLFVEITILVQMFVVLPFFFFTYYNPTVYVTGRELRKCEQPHHPALHSKP